MPPYIITYPKYVMSNHIYLNTLRIFCNRAQPWCIMKVQSYFLCHILLLLRKVWENQHSTKAWKDNSLHTDVYRTINHVLQYEWQGRVAILTQNYTKAILDIDQNQYYISRKPLLRLSCPFKVHTLDKENVWN